MKLTTNKWNVRIIINGKTRVPFYYGFKTKCEAQSEADRWLAKGFEAEVIKYSKGGDCLKIFFKRLFCRHDYCKIAWYEEYDYEHNERYAVRIYKCKKCGKEINVDGRFDPYFY